MIKVTVHNISLSAHYLSTPHTPSASPGLTPSLIQYTAVSGNSSTPPNPKSPYLHIYRSSSVSPFTRALSPPFTPAISYAISIITIQPVPGSLLPRS